MAPRKAIRRTLLAAVILIVAAYGGILIWFAAHESELMYFPEKTLESSPETFGLAYGKVLIPSTESIHLVCWVIPSADSSSWWLLYLHGNAGNMAKQGYVEHYAQLHRLGLNILTVDYRGFGESPGRPTEQGLYDDAHAAYEYLRWARHVSSDRIVVYGYSLGSAVAVDLAGRVPSAGLILEGSFPSIVDVGADHYPFIPVRWMTASRFASAEKIGSVAAPKLFIHARDDQTIPIRFGRQLFETAPGPKTFLEVGGGHESAHDVDAPVFYGGIQRFLTKVRVQAVH